MAIPTDVDKITVVAISKRKLIPITPKIRKAPIFGKESLTPLSKNGRKNTRLHVAKIAVLIIGTSALDNSKAITLFLFFNPWKTKPATKPAIVVFNKHARTVPIGLIGINNANVEGESNAIKPLKKPTTAPDNGPQMTPAKTIVINDKLILTGPNCK